MDDNQQTSTLRAEAIKDKDSQSMTMKKIIIFISSILICSWTIGFCLSYFFKGSDFDISNIYTFLPAIFTILWVLIHKQSIKDLKWKFKRPWWMYIVAMYFPLSYIVPEITIQNLFKYVSYDFPIQKLPVLLTIRVIIGATIGLGILILGEEVAWRGYLQDKLVSKLGIHKGLILLGVTWGIWHLPMIINSVNYDTDNWMFDAFVFYPLFCITLSYVIFLIMIKCNSIWIAVFIHASNNNIWYLTGRHSTILNKNGSMTVSILFFIAVIFVCAFILTKYANRQHRLAKSGAEVDI